VDLQNVLIVMRISELEGKYYWDIRDLARTIGCVGAGEVARSLKCSDPSKRYVELTFDRMRVFGRLTDLGRREADRILGMKKIPLGLAIRRRNPWIVDLTVLYEATKVVKFMACRTHHYYLEPYFLRKNWDKFELAEPEDAEIVLGVVKCTDKDKRERVPLRTLDNNLPPRIELLFKYCIDYCESLVVEDPELVKIILAIAGIRGLWGVRKNGTCIWIGRKKVDLRLL